MFMKDEIFKCSFTAYTNSYFLMFDFILLRSYNIPVYLHKKASIFLTTLIFSESKCGTVFEYITALCRKNVS